VTSQTKGAETGGAGGAMPPLRDGGQANVSFAPTQKNEN